MYLGNETESRDISISPLAGTSVIPDYVTVDEADVYTAYDFTTVLVDKDGYNDTCYFQKFVTRELTATTYAN